jgi:hypothetical protein
VIEPISAMSQDPSMGYASPYGMSMPTGSDLAAGGATGTDSKLDLLMQVESLLTQIMMALVQQLQQMLAGAMGQGQGQGGPGGSNDPSGSPMAQQHCGHAGGGGGGAGGGGAGGGNVGGGGAGGGNAGGGGAGGRAGAGGGPSAHRPSGSGGGTSSGSTAVTPPVGQSSDLGQYYIGGAPGAKDQWGDSKNINKTAVFQAVYQGVKENWDSGAIPQNVKDLFSGAETDKYFQGLNLSADPTTRAQQKAAIWELATASHETGGNYDPSKLPSYWEAGGSGSHAGQTQTAGMAADPKGMTYGMFSTESTNPINVSDPRSAVAKDLQVFGKDLALKNGNLGETLKYIGQTDSTSVIPSVQKYGALYLDAFAGT